MNLLDLILLIFSITTGNFALALVSNVQQCLTNFEKFRLIGLFTFIPALMMWVGYWAGVTLQTLMNWSNSWILIILLFVLGVRMVLKSFSIKLEDRTYNFGLMRVTLALSIALGLPAFILGLGLTFSGVNVLELIIIMSSLGLIMSLSGIIVGKKSGKYQLGNNADFLSGLLMLGIGIKLSLQLLVII